MHTNATKSSGEQPLTTVRGLCTALSPFMADRLLADPGFTYMIGDETERISLTNPLFCMVPTSGLVFQLEPGAIATLNRDDISGTLRPLVPSAFRPPDSETHRLQGELLILLHYMVELGMGEKRLYFWDPSLDTPEGGSPQGGLVEVEAWVRRDSHVKICIPDVVVERLRWCQVNRSRR